MAADFTNQLVLPTANELDKKKGMIPMEVRNQIALSSVSPQSGRSVLC